jgi:hypothetical protein
MNVTCDAVYAVVVVGGGGGRKFISCQTPPFVNGVFMNFQGLGRARDTHFFVYTRSLVRQSHYFQALAFRVYSKSIKDNGLAALLLGPER